MADKMIKAATKKPNGTASPVLADSDGRVITNRTWKKVWETIEDGVEIRDTSVHTCPAVDLREVPLYSLRFLNRLSVPVTITFLTDVNASNGYIMTNKDNQALSITIQPAYDYEMVTFNDLPELQYMQYLRLRVQAASAPAAGTFSAFIVKMV